MARSCAGTDGELAPYPSGSTEPPPSRQWRLERFFPLLVLVSVGGLLVRVLYVVIVTRHEDHKLYDAFWYEVQSLNLVKGHFFPVLFGSAPDAAHPPLTSIILTPATYFFGLRPGETPQRLTMAFLGAVVVFFVGVLGREVMGPGVGIVAALLAAGYPNMWMPSGIVMSETLTMLLMCLVLLAAYRLLRAPTWSTAVLLGVVSGAALLTRAELALTIPLLLVPVALAAKGVPLRRRLRLAGVVLVSLGVVVGPWIGRNLVSFQDTTLLSTGEGPVIAGANCGHTYAGPELGSWTPNCSLRVAPAQDQSVESERQLDVGWQYLDHHLERLPIVVLARIGRVWDLYAPIQEARTDVNEGRPFPASIAGLITYYGLLPFGVLGIIVLKRRRIRQWPLLMPAVSVTLAAALNYGLVRFRAEFEVSLVVIASVGVFTAWERLRSPA